MGDLHGHTAMVTGGAGGIGYCFCDVLAALGADVVVADLEGSRLDDAVRRLSAAHPGVKVHAYGADLTAADVVTGLDAWCSGRGVAPDILVNNAGIFSFAPVTETSGRKIECFIDLHVRAVTMLSRWFAERRVPKGSGWLLNMSSMSCWMPMPGLAMYAATKAYIRVFSRSLQYELRGTGVSVTVACPGGIATDLFGLPGHLQRLAVRLGVLETPESFARKAVRAMLKGRQQYINGLLNRFSIFFVGCMPGGVRMQVKRQLLDKGVKRGVEK